MTSVCETSQVISYTKPLPSTMSAAFSTSANLKSPEIVPSALEKYTRSNLNMPHALPPVSLSILDSNNDICGNNKKEQKYSTQLTELLNSPCTHVNMHDGASESLAMRLRAQQTCEDLTDLFDSWLPWQQRVLLCGITKHCSTSLLESLVTALEPVFHRDFVTGKQQRYPSAPFRHPSQRELNKQEKEAKAKLRKRSSYRSSRHSSRSKKSPSRRGSSERLSSSADSNHHKNGLCKRSNNTPRKEKSLAQASEKSKDEKGSLNTGLDNHNDVITTTDQKENETNLPETKLPDTAGNMGTKPRTLTDLADDMACEIMKAVLQKDTREGSHLVGDNTCVADKGDYNTVQNISDDLVDHLGNVRIQHYRSHVQPNIIDDNIVNSENKTVDQSGKAEGPAPFTVMDLVSGKRLEKTWSQHHNAWTSYSILPPLGDHIQNHHRHHSAAHLRRIHTADFFKRNKGNKLGHMQTELPVGQNQFERGVTLPLQRAYKNGKWYASAPCAGKHFVEPHAKDLGSQFSAQLDHVWQILHDWEDHETMNLLTLLLKMCSSDLISYLCNCLINRLSEGVVINWLPDHLLLYIMSMLPRDDVLAAACVCRRWHHLSCRPELWMVKCHQLGTDRGLEDMAGTLQCHSVQGDHGIDWRLAYIQLYRLIHEKPHNEDPFQTSKLLAESNKEKKHTSNNKPRSYAAQLAHQSRLLKQGEAVDRVKLSKDSENLKDEGSSKISESHEKLGSKDTLLTSGLPEVGGRGQSPGFTEHSVDLTNELSEAKAATQREEQASVMQWLQSKRNKREDDGERAVDMRGKLRQASDLTGQSQPSQTLRWLRGNSRRGGERYAGQVSPILAVRRLQGHMDAVLSIECSKRRLFSGSMDRSIRIWDARTGQSIFKLYGHKGAVKCLLFSPKYLYSGSWDTTVMVWELVTFNRTAVLTGHSGAITCLAQTSEYLLSGSQDGTVRVWKKTGFTLHREHKCHKYDVVCMATDGKHIITGSTDRKIRFTDLTSGQCVRQLTESPEGIHRLAVTGQLLLSSTVKGHLLFWSLESGQLEAAIQAHSSAINAMAFLKQGFYTASNDMTIKEWHLNSMTCVRTLEGHKGHITDLKVSVERLVSCDLTGQIRVWDMSAPSVQVGDTSDLIPLSVSGHSA